MLPEFDLVPSDWPFDEAEPSLAAVSNADDVVPLDFDKVEKPDFLVEQTVPQRDSSLTKVGRLG